MDQANSYRLLGSQKYLPVVMKFVLESVAGELRLHLDPYEFGEGPPLLCSRCCGVRAVRGR